MRIIPSCRVTVLFLLSALAFSCNSSDPDEEPQISVDNLTFEVIMEESSYFKSSSINASENGKYIISTVEIGTSKELIYSKDAGASFQKLDLDIREIFNGNISNNGKFYANRRFIDLNDESALGLTEFQPSKKNVITGSGRAFSFQWRNISQVDLYEITSNDQQKVEVEISFNPNFIAGVSENKIGFFDYQSSTIAEYDAVTKTFTKETLNIDYSKIGGGAFRPDKLRVSYSNGYFAFAKEGGCLLIAPSREITYYPYPSEYNNFMNTTTMKHLGDRLFVSIFKGTGENSVFETNGSELRETPLKFPLSPISTGVLTQGFIENGARAFSGLIKIENGNSSYLPGKLNDIGLITSESIGKTFEIGDYLYFNDKKFHLLSKTYETSEIMNISRVFYEDSRLVAYAEGGIYTSSDNGNNWTLASQEIQPKFVVRTSDGLYYGMAVSAETSNLGGTGFSFTNYGHKVYTTRDLTSGWTLLPGSEKDGFRGKPQGISSDGIVRIIDDLGSGLGNANLFLKLSRDYGVTYESFDLNGEVPDDKTSEFETKDGRKVNVFISQGSMELTLASLKTGACSKTEITLPAEIGNGAPYSFTDDNRFIITSGSVYKSSQF